MPHQASYESDDYHAVMPAVLYLANMPVFKRAGSTVKIEGSLANSG